MTRGPLKFYFILVTAFTCSSAPLFSQMNQGNSSNSDSYEKIKIPSKNSYYQQKKGGYYDSKELQVQKEDN
ncbi:MAG TPA: hypothetical protein VI112_16305, partial [Bacteroidia bacterium]